MDLAEPDRRQRYNRHIEGIKEIPSLQKDIAEGAARDDKDNKAGRENTFLFECASQSLVSRNRSLAPEGRL